MILIRGILVTWFRNDSDGIRVCLDLSGSKVTTIKCIIFIILLIKIIELTTFFILIFLNLPS